MTASRIGRTFCALLVVLSLHAAVHAQTRAASLDQAATLFALGSLDAAEEEVRNFIAASPNDARKADAIALLAEIRVERERMRAATTGASHSGATANVSGDISPAGVSPRVIDPAIISAPATSAPLKWDRLFPGAPDQFRKDGVYAVTASGEGSRTAIKIFFVGSGVVAHQRMGSMLVVDIAGLTDALPRGGIDFPSGGAKELRHSQHSTEPLVARIVIHLKSADVKSTVTSGQEEVSIVIEDLSSTDASNQGGLYREPVATATQRIDIAGGNFQRALVRDPLPDGVAAKVTQPGTGAPIPNVVVDFYAPDAGIMISPRSAVTGPDGIAVARVTLDEVAGRKIVMARIPGTPAEVSFEVYALARPPDSIRKVSGEDVRINTRQVSATPLVVIVADMYGNPIPGVEVEWAYVSGGGTVDADPDRPGNQTKSETDKDGRAVLRQWTTGPAAGMQRIQASFATGEVTKVAQFSVDVMPQLVSMDFAETPVPDILRFLGRIANWNLILSDGVTKLPEDAKNITVHFENVPIDDALDKILAMKKLTRIEQPDGSIKIVTFVEAQTLGQSVITDASILDELPQDAVRSVVLSVRPGVDFSGAVSAMGPLLTTEGKIVQDAASRKIVVTDYVSSIRRVRDVLDEFGKAEDQRILTFDNLNFSSNELREFIRQQIPAEVKSYFTGQSVIFLGPSAALDRIEAILRAIDTSEALTVAAEGAPGKTFEIVPLRSQKATDLAGILTSVFQAPTQTLLQSGINLREADRDREQATTTTTAATTEGTTPRAATTTTTTREPSLARAAFQEIKDQVRIVAEPRTNSLILYGYPSDIATVKGVIQRLDSFELAKEPITRDKISLVSIKYRSATEVLATLQRIMFPSDAAQVDQQQEQTRNLSRSLSLLYWGIGAMGDRTGSSYGSQVGGVTDYSVTETQAIPLRMFEIVEPNMIVIVGGKPEERQLVEQLIADIDQADNNRVREGVYMEVYTLEHLLPSDFNKILDQTILTDDLNDQDLWYWWYFGVRRGSSETRRMPLDASKTLIVFARRLTHAQIANLIEKIDNPQFSAGTELKVRAYPIKSGEIYAIASILTRNAVNQSADVTDEFIFVDQAANQVVVWARDAAHIKIERLLPQIDKAELKFDPLLKYEIYEFQNISVSEVIGVTTSAEREIVQDAAGFGAAATTTRDKTILQLIAEPLGTDPGRGIYPSITGNFILVWGPTGAVDRSILFARQIDRRWERSKIQVRTYRVKHGEPRAVVNFINAQVFPPPAAGAAASPTPEFLVIDADDTSLFHIWAVPATHHRVATFLEVIDTNTFQYNRYRVFDAGTMAAADLGAMLAGLYPGLPVGPVALDDGNAVIVFGDQATLDEIESLIKELDRSIKFVAYSVKNAPLENLAAIINQLYLNQNVTEQNNVKEFLRVSGGRMLVWAARATHEKIVKVLPSLDIAELPSDPSLVFTTYTFKNASLSGLRSTTGSGLEGGDDPMTQVAALLEGARISGLSGTFGSGGGNFVVLYGSADGVRRGVELLAQLDEAWGKTVLNSNFRIFELKHATPDALRANITRIMAGNMLEIVPYPGRNAIIVVSPPDITAKVAELIAAFDTTAPTRFFPLINIEATEAISILSGLFPTVVFAAADDVQTVIARGPHVMLSQVADAMAAIDSVGVELVEILNGDDDAIAEVLRSDAFSGLYVEYQHQGPNHTFMVLRAANPEVMKLAKEFIAKMENINTHFVPLTYISATAAAALLSTVYGDITTSEVLTTNSLMFIATPEKTAIILDFLKKIDRPRGTAQYRPQFQLGVDILAAVQRFVPGAVAVEVAGVIVLYGEPKAIDEALVLIRSMDVDRPMQIFMVGRTPPDDLVALIDAYYSQAVEVQVVGGAAIVAVGPRETLAAIERMLKEVEAGLIFRVVPTTQNISGAAVAMLGTMTPSVRAAVLPGGGGLALLGTEVNVAEALSLLRQSAQREMDIVPVRVADLSAVATTVQEIFPEAGIRAITEINSILVTGDTEIRRQIEEFIRGIDRKLFTAIRPLRYYDPRTGGERANLISNILDVHKSDAGTIHFDDQSNSLIITDALDRVEKILKVIDDLDRAPPQFMIEAVIAEVNLSNNHDLGFTWQFRPDLNDFGFLPRVPLNQPVDANGNQIGGSNMAFNTAGSGDFTFGVATNNLQVTLSALLANQDARIMATPKIVTRNNVEGDVNITQQIPYVQTTFFPGPPPTSTSEILFLEVPVHLTVTPSSSWSSDAIRLDVVADITTVTGDGSPPPTSTREVTTTVDMRDGQTLVIGGLMQKTRRETVQKIPLLGDIPGIGSIFRNTTSVEENVEVLIFLSPRIIYPASHDLQMEEEINRFKYLVNFPVDWSGRRWLMNNQRRNPDLRAQMRENSNFLIQPPPAPGMTAPPSIVVEPSESSSDVAPATGSQPAPPDDPQFLGGVITTYDVNTITAAELRTLPGMPAHVAQLVIAYRNANGPFASLNELMNVPGMTVSILEGVRKYLRVAPESTPMPPTPAPAPAPAPTPAPAPVAPAPVAAPSQGRVNINTATAAQLMALPGLTEANARMILAYRNTYGAFSTTAQLIDVPGITPEMYSAIRDWVTVSGSSAPAPAPQPAAQTSSTINVNTATEAQLATIPEFSTQNVKLILAYRKQYGAFASVSDLLNVPSITPELLAKVRDRLSVDGSAPAAAPAVPRVNINTATEADFRKIPELTEQNIKLIIAYRNSYGPFKNVADLLDVPSITQELFDKIRFKIAVQ